MGNSEDLIFLCTDEQDEVIIACSQRVWKAFEQQSSERTESIRNSKHRSWQSCLLVSRAGEYVLDVYSARAGRMSSTPQHTDRAFFDKRFHSPVSRQSMCQIDPSFQASELIEEGPLWFSQKYYADRNSYDVRLDSIWTKPFYSPLFSTASLSGEHGEKHGRMCICCAADSSYFHASDGLIIYDESESHLSINFGPSHSTLQVALLTQDTQAEHFPIGKVGVLRDVAASCSDTVGGHRVRAPHKVITSMDSTTARGKQCGHIESCGRGGSSTIESCGVGNSSLWGCCYSGSTWRI